MHNAVSNTGDDWREVVQLLIEKGANVNSKNNVQELIKLYDISEKDAWCFNDPS